MDDAKEFLGSILKTIRDRFSNPLVSAFAIAWLIWNFRVVLVLLGSGDGGWLAKIEYLDKRLMTPAWMWPLHGLGIPLALALAWIYVLPPVLRKVAIQHERQVDLTKIALLSAMEKAPISEEERQKLWEQFARERRSWNEERLLLLKAIAEIQDRPEQALSNVPSPRQSPMATELPFDETDPTPLEEGYFRWPTEKQASFLGLNVKVDGSKNEGPRLPPKTGVGFRDAEISWPWQVRKEGLIGLGPGVVRRVGGKILTLKEVWTLYLLRDKQLSLRNMGFDVRSIVDQLEQSGLVELSQNHATLTTNGRLFLAWMLRVGFFFVDQSPDAKMSQLEDPDSEP